MAESRKRLGEILVEGGILAPENLQEALNYQKKEGGMLGQILIRLGYISEENLVAAIGKQFRVPYIPLPNYSINADAVHVLEEEFCRRNLCLAFDQDEKKIFIAAVYPIDEMLIEEVEKKSRLRPQFFIASPTEVFNMIDLMFQSQGGKKEVKKAG